MITFIMVGTVTLYGNEKIQRAHSQNPGGPWAPLRQKLP